jgi:nucleoside-diphosphate-sugar epimerase
MKYVLLTGATGHLGSHLLKDLVARGISPALVLRSSKVPAAKRFEELLSEWNLHEHTNLPPPVCIVGDTTKPDFGLSTHDLDWVRRNCSSMMHCAASIQFTGSPDNETMRDNLASAQAAVDIFRRYRMEKLAYFSTAYVCGKRTGIIYEHQLDDSQGFRNEYEESKFKSETLIRAGVPQDQLIVLRPAIIVGDSLTARTRQFESVYRFAQFTSLLAEAASKDELGRWPHNIRLTVPKNNPLNLVPVDWVSSASVEIFRNFDFRNDVNTFHLTPTDPTRLSEIEAALRQCFNYYGVTFVEGLTTLPDPSEAEEFFYGYVNGYLDYWREDPTFDRTNTSAYVAQMPEARVDSDLLRRMFQYAISVRFGRSKKPAVVRPASAQKRTNAVLNP